MPPKKSTKRNNKQNATLGEDQQASSSSSSAVDMNDIHNLLTKTQPELLGEAVSAFCQRHESSSGSGDLDLTKKQCIDISKHIKLIFKNIFDSLQRQDIQAVKHLLQLIYDGPLGSNHEGNEAASLLAQSFNNNNNNNQQQQQKQCELQACFSQAFNMLFIDRTALKNPFSKETFTLHNPDYEDVLLLFLDVTEELCSQFAEVKTSLGALFIRSYLGRLNEMCNQIEQVNMQSLGLNNNNNTGATPANQQNQQQQQQYLSTGRLDRSATHSVSISRNFGPEKVCAARTTHSFRIYRQFLTVMTNLVVANSENKRLIAQDGSVLGRSFVMTHDILLQTQILELMFRVTRNSPNYWSTLGSFLPEDVRSQLQNNTPADETLWRFFWTVAEKYNESAVRNRDLIQKFEINRSDIGGNSLFDFIRAQQKHQQQQQQPKSVTSSSGGNSKGRGRKSTKNQQQQQQQQEEETSPPPQNVRAFVYFCPEHFLVRYPDDAEALQFKTITIEYEAVRSVRLGAQNSSSTTSPSNSSSSSSSSSLTLQELQQLPHIHFRLSKKPAGFAPEQAELLDFASAAAASQLLQQQKQQQDQNQVQKQNPHALASAHAASLQDCFTLYWAPGSVEFFKNAPIRHWIMHVLKQFTHEQEVQKQVQQQYNQQQIQEQIATASSSSSIRRQQQQNHQNEQSQSIGTGGSTRRNREDAALSAVSAASISINDNSNNNDMNTNNHSKSNELTILSSKSPFDQFGLGALNSAMSKLKMQHTDNRNFQGEQEGESSSATASGFKVPTTSTSTSAAAAASASASAADVALSASKNKKNALRIAQGVSPSPLAKIPTNLSLLHQKDEDEDDDDENEDDDEEEEAVVSSRKNHNKNKKTTTKKKQQTKASQKKANQKKADQKKKLQQDGDDEEDNHNDDQDEEEQNKSVSLSINHHQPQQQEHKFQFNQHQQHQDGDDAQPQSNAGSAKKSNSNVKKVHLDFASPSVGSSVSSNKKQQQDQQQEEPSLTPPPFTVRLSTTNISKNGDNSNNTSSSSSSSSSGTVVVEAEADAIATKLMERLQLRFSNIREQAPLHLTKCLSNLQNVFDDRSEKIDKSIQDFENLFGGEIQRMETMQQELQNRMMTAVEGLNASLQERRGTWEGVGGMISRLEIECGNVNKQLRAEESGRLAALQDAVDKEIAALEQLAAQTATSSTNSFAALNEFVQGRVAPAMSVV